ncbi:oxidoreductase [Byssothecium circinans]|uniref:Oxidoreductase n=1 Tax=Byssothecium circinans TaxID=147558 RepID=A0A6A5TPA6_9PLEO|nr:oxidoreductase [Byssothecium circinans]
MASQALFDAVPPFPNAVVAAPMRTVLLGQLCAGDVQAAGVMLEACRDMGFFLLDLSGDATGEQMVEEIDKIFGAGKEIMHLPEQVKKEYAHDPPRSFLGFKPRGMAKTETNEPDRFEWFNLGQDGLMGNEPLQPLPYHIHTHLPLFTSFLEHCQTVAKTINTALATQLGLPPNAFASLQDPAKVSGTVIRLIKADASPNAEHLRTSMIHHTDFGTITLLANVVGGLQILADSKAPTDPDAWLWVRPQPKCLIVNLGDAMVKWTGGILRSNVHRINFAPGEQRFVERLSLGVLFRPERNASMRKLIGESDDGDEEDLTAWEWEVKKAMALRR